MVPGGSTEPWREQRFPGIPEATLYEIVADEDRTVLRAVSRGSASALVRRIEIDAPTPSCLEWSWRVERPVPNARWGEKPRDDFAARLFVLFEEKRGLFGVVRGLFTNENVFAGRALSYVWATDVEAGTTGPSPHSESVVDVAVRSGDDDAGRWVSQRRDVSRDYRDAFGEQPGGFAGIALMSDTDDTGGSAIAYFGDIVLRSDGCDP